MIIKTALLTYPDATDFARELQNTFDRFQDETPGIKIEVQFRTEITPKELAFIALVIGRDKLD